MVMKVYDVVFDESEDTGVYALSCVDNPAMEDKWLTLADHPKEIQFSTVDEEKRLLLGAALIPNKKIYRREKDNEYYIKFSEDTIEKAAHNFVKSGYVNNSTENHKTELSGVSVVQSWIVEDPLKDKSANYGKTYEKGTWVTMMKVENDETWEKAKNGTLNGFSIDGFFSLKETKLENHIKNLIMSKESLKETLKEILGLSKKEEEAVKLGEVKLKDGKTRVQFDGESMEVGKPVFLMIETEGEEVKTEPMPEGSHELENGEFLHVDSNGMVAEKAIEEPKDEESAKEDVATELSEVLKDFKSSIEKKIEDVKTQLSKEFGEKIEAEKEKTKEAETKLQAEKTKNSELEAKLEAEPAGEKIVKTELKVAEPKNAKQRLLNRVLEARN